MKGVVIKAFESHIAERFGEQLLDEALEQNALSTGGAFTSVGNYPFTDLLVLVGFIAESTGIGAQELVRQFGQHLFKVLAEGHQQVMSNFEGCVDMLAGIESVIHRDVRKLYSDAQLPRFDVQDRQGDDFIVLVYHSARPFADLAHGLIEGAFHHYGVSEISTLQREDVNSDGTHSIFSVKIVRPAASPS